MTRVISLVPSLTETLLAAGIRPVGRTRYCIHPESTVADIPAVAGTKDWDFDKIRALQPDLLIIDREENAEFMADQTDIPCYVTHITAIADMVTVMQELASLLHAPALAAMAERWRAMNAPECEPWHIDRDLPGLIEWGKKPGISPDKILYLIWQRPWMAVSRQSYIGSVLQRLGVRIAAFDETYPQIDLSVFDPATTLLLFSSEPYPFLSKKGQLASLDFPHAFVDGEQIGWYGIRSLKFLERECARSVDG
ncbi:substrate-binding protein [Cohaesibacter sp. ES.047]|uniref:helical backbone metal receptor n=1 Tax=Cohaesibacter sp. ES.047 TaxID=1798205 RepID=UPI000BB79211|nr:helical backbone metal receptor [Cohaesibacter sp. ES.047]SNY91725.1 substrate-binding protein [Cohaesibacter sp. ES.047]